MIESIIRDLERAIDEGEKKHHEGMSVGLPEARISTDKAKYLINYIRKIQKENEII